MVVIAGTTSASEGQLTVLPPDEGTEKEEGLMV
jgi:hypothetical protein